MAEETENVRKLRAGEWTDGFAPEFGQLLDECGEKCFAYNSLPPSRKEERERIMRSLLGSAGARFHINPPFHCDFGFNIHIGNDFVGNFNLTILDEAEVRIGSNVFIGPNTSLCTILHSLDIEERNRGIMKALPITIADNVWIASNVTVLSGVSIGEGAIVGAGSVVTKDVAPMTVVAGNPARLIRKIEK